MFLIVCVVLSAFKHDMIEGREQFLFRMRRDSVSVVICSGITDSILVRCLLDVIAENIQVYPPIQCQMRSIVVPRVLNDVIEDAVAFRMSYVGRVQQVMFRSQTRVINIFYQLLEYPDGSSELRYGMDYFKEDADRLKTLIKHNSEVCKMPEFKCDIRVRADADATSSLVFKMTFFTVYPDTPPSYHSAARGRWMLEHIRTWPSCGIDIPFNKNVMVGDGFYVVTEHLGIAVFGYLNQYGTVGRSPI